MPDDRADRALGLARRAIEHALGTAPPPTDGHEPWLSVLGACFVTLKKGDSLRGCVGSIEARRPLVEDLKTNAVGAALHDTRFPPLTKEELADTEIEVSVLSPLETFTVSSEEEAIRSLRPGIDGVVLSFGGHQGTFLPQVWENLPDPRSFLIHLKEKAGLRGDFWSSEIRLWRYRVVDKWKEKEPT